MTHQTKESAAAGERPDEAGSTGSRPGGDEAIAPSGGGAAAGSADAAPVSAPSALEAELAAARSEVERLREEWLRAKAETENVRRQSAAEYEKARKFAIEAFAESLLPVRDSLEATLDNADSALETLRSGVELTLRQLVGAFDKAYVVQIDPQGERFDPHRHQAMTMVESDQPANTVVQVLQKGYLLQDRVLRPALVSVAKPKPDA